jgi:hypothetical protein
MMKCLTKAVSEGPDYGKTDGHVCSVAKHSMLNVEILS